MDFAYVDPDVDNVGEESEKLISDKEIENISSFLTVQSQSVTRDSVT